MVPEAEGRVKLEMHENQPLITRGNSVQDLLGAVGDGGWENRLAAHVRHGSDVGLFALEREEWSQNAPVGP